MRASTLLRRVGRRLRRGLRQGPPGPTALARTMGGLLRPGGAPELPDTLDYTGEFGAELVLFLPWCNWLSRQGLLRGRRIRTYRGMRCFYEGLDCLAIEEKDERRHYVPPGRRALPVRNEHEFGGVGGGSPFHLYPDLRRRFAGLPAPEALVQTGKPLLVVHNKYNNEWDGRPVNFIPPACLEALFAGLVGRFTVVYIRHGATRPPPGYSGDEMAPLAFDDRAVLERHPGVLVFDDLFAAEVAAVEAGAGGTDDLNTFKNLLYSRCHFFVSSQGGGAHHIAQFSGSLLVVLHRRGREVEGAYGDGYYGFMANPAPVRAICRTEAELCDSLALFDDVAVVDGRALVAPAQAELLRRLSPWRPAG